MRINPIRRQRELLLNTIGDSLDGEMPSDKRAAVTLIELRTKLEIRSLALKASMGLNMAFLLKQVLG